MTDSTLLSDDLLTDSENSLTLELIHDKLNEEIHDAFSRQGPTLIEALPAMGKSYGLIKWASLTGNPLTVFTSRHELYGQYLDWAKSAEREMTTLRLPTPYMDCPTMKETEDEKEVDKNLREKMWDVYSSGITAAEIHQRAEYYLDESLPCQENSECPYMDARDFDPENYDVLVGHYLQAHNRDTVDGRYVAFDEFPGDAYFFEPSHNRVTRAVTNYLSVESGLPFENWKDLDYNRQAPEHQDTIATWKEELGSNPHRETTIAHQQSPDFDSRAPLMVHAALEFNLLSNEWEYATLGERNRAVKSPDDEWTFLLPPPLYGAESVVALDGTPTIDKWRLVLGNEWITHEEILETENEKREYLTEVLNMGIIQTSAGTKPYQSGEYLNIKSDAALFEGIEQKHQKRPSVITSNKAFDKYEEAGVDCLIEETEHYGNLKGSNQFATTRLGAIVGSPHPPEDEAVERWGALDEVAVQRKESGIMSMKGNYLDFGPKGNALFRGVVHKEVLQAILRFGRTESDGERGARVYVHTSQLPKWINPQQRVKVSEWSDGMYEVVKVIKNSDKWPDGEWTNSEIAEETSIGSRQVGELMKELEAEEYVSSWRGGQGNAYHWSDNCLNEFTKFGRVEPV